MAPRASSVAAVQGVGVAAAMGAARLGATAIELRCSSRSGVADRALEALRDDTTQIHLTRATAAGDRGAGADGVSSMAVDPVRGDPLEPEAPQEQPQ